MIQFIIFIIFLISLAGIAFIVGKRLPELAKLPQNGHHGFRKPRLVAKVQAKIQHHHFRLFEKQMLLHKILSFVKVLTLKLETKVDHLLHGIRKKAQELDKKVKNKR